MLFTWSSTQNWPPIPVHAPTFNKCQEVIFTDKKYLTKWCFKKLAVKLRWWVGVLDCLSLFKFKVYLWVIERFCHKDWEISFSWWSVFELDLFFSLWKQHFIKKRNRVVVLMLLKISVTIFETSFKITSGHTVSLWFEDLSYS